MTGMAVRRAWVVSLLLTLLLLAGAPGRAEPVRLVVEAPSSLAAEAARIRALDPSQFDGILRLVGLEDSGPPIRVILAPEGSGPALYVPPWVAAYAYSERGIVVLLPARAPSYPDTSMDDTLRHEVAHVLIARAAGNRPLPRWFHEGTAMIAGLSWGLDDRSRLTLALLADRESSLADLDQRLTGQAAEVRRAYAIAGAFVRDLLDRHGPDTIGNILAGVSRGLSFEDAFRGATGESLAAASASFWRRQTFWYRWVPLLTSSVTLWIGITMLALWAIKRRRQRDAALRRVWEEEEERQRLAAEARLAEELRLAGNDEIVN